MRLEQARWIEISHERLCDCLPDYLSCISAKEWLKAQLGVWRFAYEKTT